MIRGRKQEKLRAAQRRERTVAEVPSELGLDV